MAKKTEEASLDSSLDSSLESDPVLDLTLKGLEKEFGKGTAYWFNDQTFSKIESLPTSSLYLDAAIGIGGYPRGRIVEIFGAESVGKTSLCLHAIREAQRRGETCAYIDMEHALSRERIDAIGVNSSKLIFSQPDCGEDALEIMERLIRTGKIGVIVCDSVSALVPKKEIEGEMGDASIGAQARLMSQAMRKLPGIISKTKTVTIFVNQIRFKIGAYGDPSTTSGGTALKFHASVRLRLSTKSANKIKNEDGNVIGTLITVDVVKNKVSTPFRTCDIPFYFDRGISREDELFELGVETGIITKAGSWFSCNGENIAQGKVKAIEWLINNGKVISEIESMVRT